MSNGDELTLQLTQSGLTMDGGAVVVGEATSVTHLEYSSQPLADNDIRLLYGIGDAPASNPRQGCLTSQPLNGVLKV